MTTRLSLNEALIKQLRELGELQIEDADGTPLVLMTLAARKRLHNAVYDDSAWSAEEQLSVLSSDLSDPEGWGASEMDVYDELYANDPDLND